jgi:PAS domain S-box-containing protein
MRTLVIFFAIASLAFSAELPVYKYFRDIPGVSADEIAAIEALQKQNRAFTYGMTNTTEAFSKAGDKTGGYSALFCDWLTELFGMHFKPSLYNWENLWLGLDSGRIDFTGDLMATEERRKKFFMTDAIVARSLSSFKIAGKDSLSAIVASRLPRFAFLGNSAVISAVESLVGYKFEPVYIDDNSNAYEMLKSGEVDAALLMGISEAAFDPYEDVVSETFFPLIYNSASLSTQKQELAPIISVVQKALQHEAVRGYLSELYKEGYNEYRKHKLFLRLTKEELEYIRENPVVKIAAEYDNYPVSFYNVNEEKWQGAVFDILSEVEKLTGLSFEVANDTKEDFSKLLKNLEEGKVSMLSELLWSKGREGRFLWPSTPVMVDFSTLISRADYKDMTFSEILNVKVGAVKGTAHAELFKRWFPDHNRFFEYGNTYEAWDALGKGEIDMVMSRQNQFLALSNYRERAGYKINISFKDCFYASFGLNKNETTLCSILNKTLSIVDTKHIAENWTSRFLDYRYKKMEARLPWLVGAAIFSLAMLIFVLLLQRGMRHGKNLEKQVLDRTAELKAVLDNYKGVIWSVDPEKNITTFGGQYLKKLGIDPAFLIGKNLERARHKNRHLDIIERVDKTYTEGAQEWISEIDGGFFHSNTTPVYNTAGDVVGVVGSNDDMTELITLQRNLEAAVKEAQAANRAKSSFLASMSHEIRTPMNAILGITEIQLQNGNLSADTKNALNVVYNSGYTLLGIINDLLDLSKIEAGKMELVNSRYETASMINDTINLNTARVGSKPIDFKLLVSEDLPYEIIGDELRVKQILNNLLSNAFKYTESGEVDLSFSAEIADEKVTLTIVVKDTGQGMTEEQVQSLFDAYARFNTKVNRFVEGTGLGMNIVQHLVKQMEGDISVSSAPGKGTEITVHLTQGYASSAKLGYELAESLMGFRLESMSKQSKAQIVREPMPYGRVLVVDDMETNLYVAKGFLLPYGLIINTALSGGEAIENIKRGNVYDIIFMDHMMPILDGIETVKAIRALGYTRPIVALTANAVAGQSEVFMANGFDGFISKPIDIRELNASLNKFVRNKQQAEVSGGAPQVSPELAKIFRQDAEKVMAVLESSESKDLQTYIINVHALKSALANIGETKLSDFAKELEQAGRDKNTDFISEKTKTFLSELRTVVDKLKPIAGEYGEGKVSDEDKEHLRKTLLSIKGACEAYDINAAMTALKELKKKKWPSPYGELLDTITRHLLNSDFDEAGAVCEI